MLAKLKSWIILLTEGCGDSVIFFICYRMRVFLWRFMFTRDLYVGVNIVFSWHIACECLAAYFANLLTLVSIKFNFTRPNASGKDEMPVAKTKC